MPIVGAQPLPIHRVPNVDNLRGERKKTIKINDGRVNYGNYRGAGNTHGILGHGEEQISLAVVFDLRDGALMALQQDRLLELMIK